MDALPPGGGSGSGSGAPGGTPPGKQGAQQAAGQQQQQQVVELFGSDLYTVGITLVLLLLGLMHASMTRCVCT